MGGSPPDERPLSLEPARVSFARLVSATGAAIAIALAASPLLTRLYSPAEFGAFGIFLGLTFADVITCGGYDRAIPIARDRNSAESLTALAVILTAGFSLLALLLVIAAGPTAAAFLNLESHAATLWLLPLALAATGCLNACNALALRDRSTSQLAVSKLTQVTTGLGVQIFAAFLPFFGLSGLALGQVAGATASTALLTLRQRIWQGSAFRRSGLRAAWTSFSEFPKFVAPSALMNSLSAQLPVLLIGKLFGPEYLGFLSLSQRVVGAPMVLFGNATAQVFLSRFARAGWGEEGQPSQTRILRTALSVQAILSLGLVAAWYPAPYLFGALFGEPWREAGHVFRLLIPLYCAQLVVAPINSAMFILGRARLFFFGEAVRLAMIVAALMVAWLCDMSPADATLTYVAGGTAGYAVTGMLSWRATTHR